MRILGNLAIIITAVIAAHYRSPELGAIPAFILSVKFYAYLVETRDGWLIQIDPSGKNIFMYSNHDVICFVILIAGVISGLFDYRLGILFFVLSPLVLSAIILKLIWQKNKQKAVVVNTDEKGRRYDYEEDWHSY